MVMKDSRRFAFMELLTLGAVLIIIILLFVAFDALFVSNAWGVNYQSALKAVQEINHEAIMVVSLKRHVFAYSEVIVASKLGEETKYLIKSNLLGNIEAFLAPAPDD